MCRMLYLYVCDVTYRKLRQTSGREEAVAALNDGFEQLKMLQRQATVSSLYPSSKSVME